MKLKYTLTTTLLFLVLLLSFAMPIDRSYAADATTQACQGIKDAFGQATACGKDDKDAEGKIAGLAIAVINVMSWVIGILAIIMLIVAGFRYIISGGDSNGISGAKNAIIYAIVGLVIVVLAQVIVRYVISSVAPPPTPPAPTQNP